MANTIKVKRSAVAAKVPTTTDLELGEIAVNTYDGKMYIKKDDGTESVVEIGGGGAGSGDVVGPGSATDNAITRFDGTTGKLIQDSGITIDDNNNSSGTLSQTFADGTAVTTAAGKMWYNDTTGSWNLGMGGGNVTQQVGEELYRYGKASSAITESPLQLVYKTGVVGASGEITFAPAVSGITDYDQIIGCATEDIALNSWGRVTTYGVVRNITTNGTAYGETWADNDDIYYNPATGGLTKTEPVAPNIKLFVGTVINAAAGGAGSFIVKLGVGLNLSDIGNVEVTSPTGGQLLSYNQTGGYWSNINLTDGTAISITETTGGAITIDNTGVTSLTGTASEIDVSASTGAVTLSLPATINANTTGNAATATQWATGRTITLTGDVTGTSGSFDGSGNLSFATTIAANSVALGTDTTGNYVASITNGSYLTGGNGGSEGAALTLAVDATNANTASKVVARDASGNFSAGTITASLTGNASTATTLQTARTINSVSFNGSANIVVEPYVEDDEATAATRLLTFVDNSTAGYKRLNEDSSLTYNPSTNTLTAGTFSGALTGNVTGNVSGSSGSCTGNAATATLAADSTLAGGLAINTTGTNNVANQIVRTQANGYANFGWINTISGTASGAPVRIYCSQDAYIRYYTPAQLAPYLTAGDVSAGVVAGKMIYDTFTATAAQTTFTPSQTYNANKIEVYVNGVKMRNGSDVTVTSGTSVVFASGLTVGDLVDLVYPL